MLALKATERNTQSVEGHSEQNGVKVNIEKISVTPMYFTLCYDQVVAENVRQKWDTVYVDFGIKDDLGNHYSGQNNGGSGDDPEGYNMSLSKTFSSLDPKAKKLIITPQIRFSQLYKAIFDQQGKAVKTNDGRMKEVRISDKPGQGSEKFELPDIIVELKK